MQKVVITGYKDVACQDATGNAIALQVNPQELQLDYNISYGDKGGSGGDSKTTEHAGGESAPLPGAANYETPDLTIETVVDATGVLPDPGGLPTSVGGAIMAAIKFATGTPTIEDYIKKLKDTCYYYVEETHGPPYLTVTWGSVLPSQSTNIVSSKGVYKCQLQSLSVKYVLFSAQGHPVRAELTLKFKGVEDPEARAKGNSPDLSHFIEIKHGDNLPKLCEDIYGSPEFFMAVARINDLPSVYAIEPGMRLLFPPLDKASR